MTTRAALHDLLDDVPDSFLPFVQDSITRICERKDDPFWKALAEAPIEDEELTPEELAGIEAGRASRRAGLGISTEALETLLRG